LGCFDPGLGQLGDMMGRTKSSQRCVSFGNLFKRYRDIMLNSELIQPNLKLFWTGWEWKKKVLRYPRNLYMYYIYAYQELVWFTSTYSCYSRFSEFNCVSLII
jgi:hypothetical protein